MSDNQPADAHVTAGDIIHNQGIVAIGNNITITINGHLFKRLYIGVPPAPEILVGRGELVRSVKQKLLAGGTLAISAFKGLPGVGKTALAATIAHDADLLEHFTDGVLWVGLGQNPDQIPLLGQWGEVLGIASEDLSRMSSLSEIAIAVHNAIGQRSMLLVIDDAWDAQAALNFKLGGPNCAHLLTTRKPEVALRFTVKGVIEIPELSEEDGLLLLTELASKAVEAEPEEARKLVAAVGSLPLALVLMGGYLRQESYSGQPRRIHAAIEELNRTIERMKLTQPESPLERHPSLGDTPLSLLAAINLSDGTLEQRERQAIRALAVFAAKPNDFSEEAAVAVSLTNATALNRLTDSGLLESAGPQRYALHQTIADYMRANLAGEIGEPISKFPLPSLRKRHAIYYLNYMNRDQAKWQAIEQEWTQVRYGWQYISEMNGEEDLALRYVGASQLFQTRRGLQRERLAWLERGLALAERLDNQRQQAIFLSNLGSIYAELGNKQKAMLCYEQALPIVRKLGDAEGESSLLNSIGSVYLDLGEQQRAIEYSQQALPLAKQASDRMGEAGILNLLGQVHRTRGEQQQALEQWQQSLLLQQQIGNSAGEAVALNNIGGVYYELGEYNRTLEYCQQALVLLKEAGDLPNQADALNAIGLVYTTQNKYDEASEYFEKALSLERQVEDRNGEATTLNNIGAMHGQLGDWQQAIGYHQQSLLLRRQIQDRQGEARTLANIATSYAALEQYEPALTYFSEALSLARAVGDVIAEANLLNNMGETYSILGQQQQALEHYLLALPLMRKSSYRKGEARVLENLGTLYYAIDEKPIALGYFEQALLALHEIGNSLRENEVMFLLAALYMTSGKEDKGLGILENLVANAQATQDPRLDTYRSMLWRLRAATQGRK